MARRLVVQRQSDLDIQAAAGRCCRSGGAPSPSGTGYVEEPELRVKIQDIAQSRGSALLRGEWEKFSFEMLIALEARFGRGVHVGFARER